MPSIEELQRFQFEDFALENTRRGKLTVLGEHAFGAEQGRIVTAPVTAESSGGGGGGTTPPEEKTGACCIDGTCSIMTAADCGSAGGVYQGDNSVCDPNPCATCPPPDAPTYLAATYSFTGSVAACDDFEVDVPISGSGSMGFDLAPWFDLVESDGFCEAQHGEDDVSVSYECPVDCGFETAERQFHVAIYLRWFPAEETYKIALALNEPADICGGDPGNYEDNITIGSDPTGSHHIEVTTVNGSTDFVLDIDIT